MTDPVIRDAQTAVIFAKELKLLLCYLGVGEANMEKGEMRVEANISVSADQDKLGIKTEIKNLNSFKAVEKAITYEIDRQTELLEKAQKIVQETRGWDENAGKTFLQRKKESSHDYRYFPDPDIPKLKVDELKEFSRQEIIKDLPELPWEKRHRYKKDFKMTEKETAVFIDSPEVAKYFEEVIKDNSKIIKLSINYILTDYLGLIKKQNNKINIIDPKNFSKLMIMINEEKLSSRGAKDVLAIMIRENKDPNEIAQKNNLIQKSDEEAIKKIIEKIIVENKSVVDDYKKGKLTALQFLIGQGMKASNGSANPELLKKIIIESLR